MRIKIETTAFKNKDAMHSSEKKNPLNVSRDWIMLNGNINSNTLTTLLKHKGAMHYFEKLLVKYHNIWTSEFPDIGFCLRYHSCSYRGKTRSAETTYA